MHELAGSVRKFLMRGNTHRASHRGSKKIAELEQAAKFAQPVSQRTCRQNNRYMFYGKRCCRNSCCRNRLRDVSSIVCEWINNRCYYTPLDDLCGLYLAVCNKLLHKLRARCTAAQRGRHQYFTLQNNLSLFNVES